MNTTRSERSYRRAKVTNARRARSREFDRQFQEAVASYSAIQRIAVNPERYVVKPIQNIIWGTSLFDEAPRYVAPDYRRFKSLRSRERHVRTRMQLGVFGKRRGIFA